MDTQTQEPSNNYCRTCGYTWMAGTNGAHSCVRQLKSTTTDSIVYQLIGETLHNVTQLERASGDDAILLLLGWETELPTEEDLLAKLVEVGDEARVALAARRNPRPSRPHEEALAQFNQDSDSSALLLLYDQISAHELALKKA